MTASQIQPEALLAARERWVARGVSAPAIVAVVRRRRARRRAPTASATSTSPAASAARTSATTREAVVDAIHAQVDQYLHQCFMVAAYEPYVDVCRRLGELSPCRGDDQKSLLLNSGAEAVENAVKIARAATGRPAIVAFDRGFHGRTLLTMTLTSKVKPYKQGFGPFAPEVYRAPAPYPYRGISSDDAIAGARAAVQRPRRPGQRRRGDPRARPGRGRLHPDARATSPRGCASSATATGSSGSTTRSRPASAAPGRCGRSSTTTRSPTCSSPASRSAAACRSRP